MNTLLINIFGLTLSAFLFGWVLRGMFEKNRKASRRKNEYANTRV